MGVKDFLEKEYPRLKLKAPLFYNWEVGIRFELGIDIGLDHYYPNSPYIQGAFQRAVKLFEAVHSPEDTILIVLDNDNLDDKKKYRRKLKNFPRYVEKSLLYKVQYEKLPYIYFEDEEAILNNYQTHRFTLKCKVADLRYKPLLKDICSVDLGISSRICSLRVFFINLDKKTIFHVYDDRGCDLIAPSPEVIKDIYINFNDWILDYDRAKIDKVFSKYKKEVNELA